MAKKLLPIGTIFSNFNMELEIIGYNDLKPDATAPNGFRCFSENNMYGGDRYPYRCRRLSDGYTDVYSVYPQATINGVQVNKDKFIIGNFED